MVRIAYILILFSSLIFANDKLISKIKENIKEEKKVFVPPESPNVLEWTGLLMIKLYQNFISSQDRPSCVFYPSCSRYTEEAIKKYGIIKGVIMGADRLERCHPQAFGNYPIHEETQKNFDPVP
ncbi:MAG: membrane protein insertion efficiency factor YidD [Brevinematales bacterium]|nr:membrane protein insertion efficiency factor YidD [Brevinematales bacterium]